MRLKRDNKSKWRYNPPPDAIDAGVVKRMELGTVYQTAYAIAEEQNKILDEWRKERKHLKNLTTNAKLSDLIKSYKTSLSFSKLGTKTQESYLYDLKAWYQSRVGGVPLLWAKLEDIKTPMCQRVYEEHAARSVSFANHSLAVYRLLFNYAIRQGFTNHNPFSKVQRRIDKARKTVWTKEDVKAFLEVAYSSFKWRNVGLIVQMAYEWGQRMGDMRMLKWENYDMETGVLSLEQSKRRARITLPTSEGLQAMLKQQHDEYGWQQYVAPSNKADRNGGLVPYSLMNLSRVGDVIKKEAQLPEEIKLMDLRRTAVTEMIEAEVPLPNIMAMTGHATPQSVAPYLKHTLKGATVAARMRGFV
jgi:integrase